MSQGLNRVMLLGNIGADPELRFTQGGQAVLNMRLATTESYLDKDKVRRERTDWHNIVVWGKRAEGLQKVVQKGSQIFVEGSLRTSSYEDREGNKRYKTEVVAADVLLCGRAPQSAGQGETTGAANDTSNGGAGGGGGGGAAGAPARAPGYAQSAGGGGASGGGGYRPARRGDAADDFDQGEGGGFGGSDDDIPFISSSIRHDLKWMR